MNSRSRSQNVMRNVSFGLTCRLIDFVFNFVVRIIFVRFLGQEILGINGLFTNILTWLSLADLGFGTAMSFSYYKPLAEKDVKKLVALTNFYKRVYGIIMVTILIVGLLCVPFLDYLVKVDTPIPYLKSYYVILLLNTTCSYLFVYKSAILRADQNEYVISLCSTLFNIMKAFTQIFFLLFLKSYHLFLLIQVLFTIFHNLFVSWVTDKRYPFLKRKGELAKEDKKTIYQNVFSVLLYKVSGILLNGTDNVLISVIVGTVYVGYYSNYLFAINSISGFISIIFSSVYGSLGNLLNKNDKAKSEDVFYHLLYFGYFIGCITSACFLGVFNDFISIFFGSEYLLSNATVIVIILNYYLSCICQPIWTFRETLGSFRKVRYVMLLTAFVNLVFSVIFGIFWGVFGILLASIMARLITYFWYEPCLIYEDVFKKPIRTYFKLIGKYFVYGCIASIPALIMFFIENSNIFILFIKLFVSGMGSLIIYVLLTKRDARFRGIAKIIFDKLERKSVVKNG